MVVVEDEVHGERGPDLAAHVRDDGEAGSFIAETDPGDLLEGREGCGELWEILVREHFGKRGRWCIGLLAKVRIFLSSVRNLILKVWGDEFVR